MHRRLFPPSNRPCANRFKTLRRAPRSRLGFRVFCPFSPTKRPEKPRNYSPSPLGGQKSPGTFFSSPLWTLAEKSPTRGAHKILSPYRRGIRSLWKNPQHPEIPFFAPLKRRVSKALSPKSPHSLRKETRRPARPQRRHPPEGGNSRHGRGDSRDRRLLRRRSLPSPDHGP